MNPFNGKWSLTPGILFLILSALLTLNQLYRITLDPIENLIATMFDDAAYYLTIARNAVDGLGFTFDGINPTNGFQPLWMLLLLPVCWITSSGGQELILRGALLTQQLMGIVTLILMYAVLKKRGASVLIYPVAVFLIFFPGERLITGMETPLLIMLLMLFWFHLERSTSPNTALTGYLLGLILLTRLDMIYFVIPFWGYYFLLNDPGRYRSVLLQVLIVTALLLPYFLFNLINFDHLMPISGALNNSFPFLWE